MPIPEIGWRPVQTQSRHYQEIPISTFQHNTGRNFRMEEGYLQIQTRNPDRHKRRSPQENCHSTNRKSVV